jgi:predicted O-methyltransferase YrrM
MSEQILTGGGNAIQPLTSEPSVQLSVLCGMERNHWISPTLHQGLLAAVTARAQAGWHIESVPGYDHRTSQQARNEVTGILLSEQTEWLLMIDNDTSLLGPSGYVDPFMLIESAIAHGARIMAAPVPCMKGDKWHINVYRRLEKIGPNSGWHAPVGLNDLRQWEADPHTPIAVDTVGTGMIAIHRSVFEELGRAATDGLEAVLSVLKSEDLLGWYTGLNPHQLRLDNSHRPSYLGLPHWLRPRLPSGADIIGEDIFFCERARAAGIQPYILPAAYSGHYHTYEYSRAPQLMFALADRPTAEDYQLDSLHGLEPGPMSIQPWQAVQLRRLLLESRYGHPNGDTIVEFGGGVSSLVLLDALPKDFKYCRLLTIESDPSWAERLRGIRRELLPALADRWEIIVDLAPSPRGAVSYENIPFIFIDGPQVTQSDPKARWNTLPPLLPYLSDGCLIVMDDYNRPSEKAALEHWQSFTAFLVLQRTIGPPDRTMAVIRFNRKLYEAARE